MWNRKELFNKLDDLKEKAKINPNEEILKDILKIEEMLYSSSAISISDYVLIIQNNNLYNSIEYLQNQDYKFLFDLDYVKKTKIPLYLPRNKISKDRFLEIVLEFFKDFDNSHYDLLKYLCNENRINVINKKNFAYESKGSDYYLTTDKSSYISFRYLGKLSEGSVLPHEIGHAYQEQGLNYNEYIKLHYSLFRETYAKFLEYAFADYLKETSYKKIGEEIETSLIEEINVLIEYYKDSFFKLKNSEFSNGRFYLDNELVLMYATLRNFYSELLAMYFLSIYRKNKKDTLNEIKIFNENIYKLENRELLERYTNKLLKEGYYQVALK